MSYDANGNMTSFTDSKGNVTTFGFDTGNRVISKTDATGLLENCTYDARGNLAQVDRRSGKRTVYSYDALNRRTLASFYNASNLTTPASTVAFTWDAGNRLTQIVDSVSGTITRTYNSHDQLLSETTPQGQVNPPKEPPPHTPSQKD